MNVGSTSDGKTASPVDGSLWQDLSEQEQIIELNKVLHSHPFGLLGFWREYFQAWSIQDLGAADQAFAPLYSAAKLGLEGASDHIKLVEAFHLSDGIGESRNDFAALVEELESWVTEFIPIQPEGFGLSQGNYLIENNEHNLAKLRKLNAEHIWTSSWLDVSVLVDEFVDLRDNFSVSGFFVTTQPHDSNIGPYCDLECRITCLLCDGSGESSGFECPACQGGGEFIASGLSLALSRGIASLAE